MHSSLILASLIALMVYGFITAAALRAIGRLRMLGMAAGIVGVTSLLVYVPIAWQTRAYLRGHADTFPGMPVYNWATVAMFSALALALLAAVLLHRAGIDPRWWRVRR